MEPLDELFPDVDPYEEDLEEPEDDEVSLTDLENLTRSYDSLAGAIVNHYHKIGAIPNPNDMMPVAWHMEMGPAFAEAQAEASANAEGADSSAPDISVDADSGELGAEAGAGAGAGAGGGGGEAGGEGDGGGEAGAGDGPSISFDFGDFGGDFGGFGPSTFAAASILKID